MFPVLTPNFPGRVCLYLQHGLPRQVQMFECCGNTHQRFIRFLVFGCEVELAGSFWGAGIPEEDTVVGSTGHDLTGLHALVLLGNAHPAHLQGFKGHKHTVKKYVYCMLSTPNFLKHVDSSYCVNQLLFLQARKFC